MDTSDHQETISTLNHLIEAVMGGQQGYRQAADEARDADLKALCGECSAQRAGFAGALPSARQASAPPRDDTRAGRSSRLG